MPDYVFVGQELGRYRLLQGIGRGGMAEVYLAEDTRLDRKVAIKILPAAFAQESTFLARFEREARAAARLAHPHILSVYDYGQQNDITYLVMPYIAGGSLSQVIHQARGPLPLGKVVQWTEEMGSALQYAHSQGIIHRDVKPGNMLLGDGGHLLLSDFGIAKVVDANTALTSLGSTVGSPEYMAPEQASGDAGASSDIYSLGVVVFQMLTGRLPFTASTPVQIMLRHVQDPPPSPRSLNPAISPQVAEVVLKALAKRPAQRFQAAGELAEALKTAVGGRSQSPVVGPPTRPDYATRLAPESAPAPRGTRPAPPAPDGPAPAFPAAPVAAPPARVPRTRSRPADVPPAGGAWSPAPASQGPRPQAVWPQTAPAEPYIAAPGTAAPRPRKRGQGLLLFILVLLLLAAAALGGMIFYLLTHPGAGLHFLGF